MFCSCQVSWLKFHTLMSSSPCHPISLDSVIHIIFPEQQKLWSSLLCNFHHLPITSLCSLTPSMHTHLLWWQCHTHLKQCAKLQFCTRKHVLVGLMGTEIVQSAKWVPTFWRKILPLGTGISLSNTGTYVHDYVMS